MARSASPHLNMDEVLAQIGSQLDAKRKIRAQALLDKAHNRDSLHALARLTTMVDGRARIRSQPPLLVPLEELLGEREAQGAYDPALRRS